MTTRRALATAMAFLVVMVSGISGLFDGGLGNDELTDAMAAFQAFLLVVTGVVGVLAAVRARHLLGVRSEN